MNCNQEALNQNPVFSNAKKVFVPVDVIMVAVERTKAVKLFQMSRHNIITVGKQLCQRGSSGKVITGLWRITEPFFSFFF